MDFRVLYLKTAWFSPQRGLNQLAARRMSAKRHVNRLRSRVAGVVFLVTKSYAGALHRMTLRRFTTASRSAFSAKSVAIQPFANFPMTNLNELNLQQRRFTNPTNDVAKATIDINNLRAHTARKIAHQKSRDIAHVFNRDVAANR